MTTTSMSADLYTRRNYIQTAVGGAAVIGGGMMIDKNQSQAHAAQEDWSIEMAGMSTTKPVPYNKYIYTGSGNGDLYKVDSESESVVARKPVDGAISLHGIAVNDSGVTIATAEGTIRHFDHQLNNQWETSISGYASAIKHESGNGYFGFATDDSSDRVFSLDGEGNNQYQTTVGDGYHDGREIGTVPTITSEYIIAKASDRLSVVEKASGNIVSDKQFDEYIFLNETHGSCITNGTVYTAGDGGELYKYDIEDGDVEWNNRLENNRLTKPVTDGEKIYITGDKLYAVSTVNGSVQWEYDIAAVKKSSPIIKDGQIYMVGVGSDGHRKVASINTDGTEAWSITSNKEITQAHDYFTPALSSDGNHLISREDRDSGKPVLAGYKLPEQRDGADKGLLSSDVGGKIQSQGIDSVESKVDDETTVLIGGIASVSAFVSGIAAYLRLSSPSQKDD